MNTKIKKVLAIVLLLIFSLTSCTGANQKASRGVISPKHEGNKPKLTILTNGTEYDIFAQCSALNRYLEQFERDFGVYVEIKQLVDKVDTMSNEDKSAYIEKLSTKLLSDDGPELIFCYSISPNALIEQGAVVDLRDKVPNISKIYDKLLEEQACYIPITMCYSGIILFKDELKRIGMQDINLDWDSNQYYKLQDELLVGKKVYLDKAQYRNAFERYITTDTLYDKGSNILKLDTAELKENINKVRNIVFGGQYIRNDYYKYEDYYNMLFELTSEEYHEGIKSWSANLGDKTAIGAHLTSNIFNANGVYNGEMILMPEFKDRVPNLNSYGFLVSKRGENLDLAYEFINGLLDDEVQMELYNEPCSEYNNVHTYPVSKDIEDDIRAKEAGLDPKQIEIKEYALQELKAGRCKLYLTSDQKLYMINKMIYKDLAKFILADEPYSTANLSVELKLLEDKYNIWLNE